jgi:5,10-methylenetetrahydromethanopterin reductase
MSLDLIMLGNVPVQQLVLRAKLAESNGFGGVWVADERFYREVYSLLAIIATETSKVRLGPCVTDPYARHPALTAMAIATLDEISDGRAVLGIGAGISGFEEMGVERPKPAKAMREAIELIRMLLTKGSLNFKPPRAKVPVYVASNSPMGQRMAGGVADGAIAEACASVEEVKAFRAVLSEGAAKRNRDLSQLKVVARLNTCISKDAKAARDAVRPSVARALGAGRMKFLTAQENGLTLPAEAVAPFASVPYHSGTAPFAPLLPLITDRHVDAFTLAGTVDDAVAHVDALLKAGVDSVIILPFAPPGGTVEDTIVSMGKDVWPQVRKR